MDPQSYNRYSYVRNDPVNLVDPTGMSFFGEGGFEFFDLTGWVDTIIEVGDQLLDSDSGSGPQEAPMLLDPPASSSAPEAPSIGEPYGSETAIKKQLEEGGQIPEGDVPEIRAGDVIKGLYRFRYPYNLFPDDEDDIGKRWGHEWLEAVPEDRSWGWYPEEPPNSMEALLGLKKGSLNAGGGLIDPHHGSYGDPGVQKMEVLATRDFKTRAELMQAIDDFAQSYSGQWGLVGCSCRSFQNRLFRDVGLRAGPPSP